MKKLLFPLVFLTFCFANAQDFYELLKIDSFGGYVEGGDDFGSSIAVSGNYAVIGDPTYNPTGDTNSRVGAIHIFSINSAGVWGLEQTIQKPSVLADGLFGRAVAIDGTSIVVGVSSFTYIDGTIADGTVYVYNRDSSGMWSERQVLSAINGQEAFGNTVAIDGNHIVVGAPGTSGPPTFNGEVFIYEKDASGVWADSQILTATPMWADDRFGRQMAIDGNYLLVATRSMGNDPGSVPEVYIYEKESNGVWTEKQKLRSSESFDGFASSISIHGSTALISASGDSGNIGAAYVYERDVSGNWIELQKLTATIPPTPSSYPRGNPSFTFGTSVAIQQNSLLIGSTTQTGLNGFYFFSKESNGVWQEMNLITPSSNTTDINWFSYKIAFNGNHAFVSALDFGGEEYTDTSGEIPITSTESSGVVYVFGPAPIPCDEVAIPDSNFEQYLIDSGIDTDATINGTICRDDAEAATSIFIYDFANFDTMDLAGIEAFINIHSLILLPDDGSPTPQDRPKAFQNLDLSSMTNLNEIYIYNTLLNTVDISSNINLTSIDINNNPQFTNLDVTNNVNLVTLNASRNRIGELDLTNNLALIEVDCSENQITSLEVGVLPNLETLECQENLLPFLDVSGNPSLVTLDSGDNLLTTENLIIDDLPSIVKLDVNNNNLDDLDITIYPTLGVLWARDNNLSELDFSFNPELIGVDIINNFFIDLDFSMNPNFDYLMAYNNNIESLNIQNGSIERNIWVHFNPNLYCVKVDDPNYTPRKFWPYDNPADNPSVFGGEPGWTIGLETELKTDCPSTPNEDTVLPIVGHQNISLGQEVTISVDYTATTDRAVVLAFQQENPYAHLASQIVDVPAGTGTVDFTFTVPGNVNIGNEHNYVAFITEQASSNPWGDKFDVERQDVTVTAAPNIDSTEMLTGPVDINPGQEVTISVDYTATTNRAVVLALQQENPYAHVASQLTDVPTGSGTVDFTFTVPANANLGLEHNYVAYITEQASSNPWGDKFDVERQDVTVSAPTNVDTTEMLSGPADVNPGQEVTISVDYTATTHRVVVLAFQQENPYAHIASQLIDVPAGSGTVDFTFTVPGNLVVGNEHNYVAFITVQSSSNPWGDKFDVERQDVTVSAATTPLTASIEEENRGDLVTAVEVFPNPVVDFVNIQLPSTKRSFYVSVMNISGVTVYKTELSPSTGYFQVDMTSYSSGIYLLEVRTDTTTEHFKLIKN